MVSVKEIKNSLRIDHSLDDDLIQTLIVTAEDYIKGAIDSKGTGGTIESYTQFNWSVSLLTQHWYLNRQEATAERLPATVQAMIQQMRGKYYGSH